MTKEEALETWLPVVEMAIVDANIPEAKEALEMAFKALEQEPCEDAPDINVGNIYECSCGYGWDKSKVVRHHFCPNCGRAVEPSYNSIKTELKPCEGAISREKLIQKLEAWDHDVNAIPNYVWMVIREAPPVTPAEKVGRWIKTIGENGITSSVRCSECGFEDNRYMLFRYCPNCGAKMQEVKMTWKYSQF